MKIIHFLLPLAAAFVLTGCGSGEAEKATKNTDGTGRIVLEVTDAPVDYAAKVVIQYTGVELKSAVGNAINFDFTEPKQIDLIQTTQSGVPATLLNENIPEGQYSWFRLKVDDEGGSSYIELTGGGNYPLSIPSANEAGLIVNKPFTLERNKVAGFVIDFDLRKSIVKDGMNYHLKPVLRTVPYTNVNLLSVEVAPEIIADQCGLSGVPAGALDYAGAVYLFTGKDVVPDDVDGPSDAAPVMTAAVYYSESRDYDLETKYDAYFARLWSIPLTEYTVVYTCDRGDDPEIDDPGLGFASQTLNLNADLLATDLDVIVKLEP